MPAEHTGSNNICSDNASDSDSESDFDRRFWEKVERREDVDCWPWTGTKMASGRGQVHIRWDAGKNVRKYAPVVAWELTNGRQVPLGCVVAHSCDNPNCVNPSHLRAVPQAENIRDSVRKGRYNAFGIQKLNAVQVLAIRARGARGERQRTIAADFGIAKNTVSQILSRKLWAHLAEAVFERVATVALPLREMGDLFNPSRQAHEPFQSVHASQSAETLRPRQFNPLEGGR
jgi:HNH endonuclease